ncbi:MAG: hypothetical protein HZC01_00565 [Candidatus Kerfeldbacteria bacterium]|nr:hypothetical protein [Candidatus Kerfeldbacteria bacterium]
MIHSNITVIDPVNDPYQWYVVWTTTRAHVYLIQTFRDSPRHQASTLGCVAYRYIEPVPFMSELQLATMVLREPACWTHNGEEKLIIQLVDFSFSGECVLQVVDGPKSLITGLIRVGEQAFFHATGSQGKTNYWFQTSPVTHIFSADPIPR